MKLICAVELWDNAEEEDCEIHLRIGLDKGNLTIELDTDNLEMVAGQHQIRLSQEDLRRIQEFFFNPPEEPA
jgi:hypothetical protein